MSQPARKADGHKLSVLFCTSGLAGHLGGTAFSEALLASALSKTCDLNLICPQGKADPKFVAENGLSVGREFTSAQVLAAFFSAQHPLRLLVRAADVVHINGHWSVSACLLARVCETENTPYVVHPRGMLIVGIRSQIKKRVFNWVMGFRTIRKAARVIALSQFETRQFSPYRLPSEKLAIVPNGIVSQFHPRETQSPNPYFLYLGRLESRKNLTALIEAFAEHRTRNQNTSLVFIGPAERGYDDILRKMAESLRVSDQIRILPAAFGATKTAWLSGARAVIYPSIEEAFGRVPFEAVAEGVYPIVPRESGSAEYLAPYLDFCFFSLQEKGSLAQALDRLGGELPPAARTSLSTAKKWVAEELAPDHVAARIRNLYLEILAN